MRNEREVLSFIIVPPYEKRAHVVASKERFEAYLVSRFPGYDFTVGPFAPVGDENQFCVLPVMNFAGDDGNSYMCVPPKSWFISDIEQACREFDRSGVKFCAA